MNTEIHKSITMTLKEAGDKLGMSQPVLRQWIAEGKLKTVRSSPTSDRRKITQDQLLEFVKWLESEKL
jgi:excisionase family DNA binding protein